MRRIPVVVLALSLTALFASSIPAGADRTAAAAGQSEVGTYVVLYTEGASLEQGRQAVAAAGGTVLRENAAIGLATVETTSKNFVARARRQPAVRGVARDRVIGSSQPGQRYKFAEERLDEERARRRGKVAPTVAAAARAGFEPLAPLQWDMQMIDATPEGSYATQPGNRRVLVGVIDTGIDANHPDIRPNFNNALSRNFTVDDPLVDGPCEEDPDGSCIDPPTVDEDGHGTHVAGTIASPINGLGIAGVAPGVKLVNLRAGQDSGFFFLGPTVDALTYAGDNGIDVVNMSFFVDPWLYNCPTAEDSNPAPTPEQLLEQQTIIEAMTEALNYAHNRNVTLVGAAGNSHIDLGASRKTDEISPDYPPGNEIVRVVTNNCLDLPTEGPNVLSISSVGPSTMKADYSNYGSEQITVSAPGGYFRDYLGTPFFSTPPNMILAPYPEAVGRLNEDIDEDGFPTSDFVIRDCNARGRCAYYQYIQGTSMATPHAVGVAALIVSEFGTRQGAGLTMNPAAVEAVLVRSATQTPCPDPPTVDYTLVGRDASWNATCVGTPFYNNFYGRGIVNASAAVS